MAQYNFEGDLNGINERQLEFINKVIVEQGLNYSKATFEQVGIAGDNYASTVKRIVIQSENGTMNMILKLAPASEVMRKSFNTFVLFNNEHIMYTEFLPLLLALQKEADVPEEEQLKFAKCYGSLAEEPNEVIILEDLKTLDFVMLDRFQPLSDECVKSILKKFAILHSLSYVLKNKEPEKYEYFKTSFADMLDVMQNREDTKFYFKQMESNTLMLLDEPKHKDIIRNTVTDVMEMSVTLRDYAHKSKNSVIIQGDAWTNNFMFRFEEGELKESIMIDYQLSRHHNPVFDILHMIFNCTDHESRAKHYLDWIDYYHAELDRSLHYFGLKASVEYPKDQLETDLRKSGKCLFGFSIFTATLLTLKSEDAGKMQAAMETGDMSKMADTMNEVTSSKDGNISIFKKRVIGLIDTCTKFNLL